jgi:Rdx family
VSLAQELTLLGHDAQPVPGEKSQYDIVADGQLVFSKQREHRFPELDEIVAVL